MAAPSRTVPHPGRALAALCVLILAMLLGILGGELFTPSQWQHQFKVGLGLDLSSGTQVTLKAETLSREAPVECCDKRGGRGHRVAGQRHR